MAPVRPWGRAVAAAQTDNGRRAPSLQQKKKILTATKSSKLKNIIYVKTKTKDREVYIPRTPKQKGVCTEKIGRQ
jgi:Zn-dependent M28 family amino/carboxypeptidase